MDRKSNHAVVLNGLPAKPQQQHQQIMYHQNPPLPTPIRRRPQMRMPTTPTSQLQRSASPDIPRNIMR